MQHSFEKTAVWRFAGLLLGVMANLTSLHLYREHLAEGVLGIALVVWQFMAWMPYFDGGYRLSVNRALLSSRDPEERRRLVLFAGDFASWFTVAGLLVGVPAATLYSLAPNARASGLPIGFFACIGLTGGLSMWMWSLLGLLTGVGRQARVYQLGCLNHVLNLGCLWLGFRCGLGAYAFPISFLAGAGVCGPLAWLNIRAADPALPPFRLRWSPEFAGNLRRFRAASMPALRFQLYALILYSIDLPLVDLLVRDPKASDAYGVSLRILTLLRLLLQSADEATWPLVAQDRVRGVALSRSLIRINAWLYGLVLGPMLAVLAPLLFDFSAGKYAPGGLLIALLVARVLVTGLASQASYFLHGDGRFRELAANHGRELLVGILLSLMLSRSWGAVGVAAGFVIATAAGALIWTPWLYARMTAQPAALLLAGLWSRAAVGLAVTGGVTVWLSGVVPSMRWSWLVVAGAGGGLAGLVLVGGWIGVRRNRSEPGWRGWLAGV